MRRPLIAAALALTVAAPASAAAPSDSRSMGGCRYYVVQHWNWHVGPPNHYTVVLGAAAVLYAESDPARPVSATLTCYFKINGVLDDDVVTFAGTGAIAGVTLIDYVRTDEQVVGFCERFDFADDTPATTRCHASGHSIGIPPEEVDDVLYDAAEAAGSVGAACDAVRTAPVPQLDWVLGTGDDGDVMLANRRLVDCP